MRMALQPILDCMDGNVIWCVCVLDSDAYFTHTACAIAYILILCAHIRIYRSFFCIHSIFFRSISMCVRVCVGECATIILHNNFVSPVNIVRTRHDTGIVASASAWQPWWLWLVIRVFFLHRSDILCKELSVLTCRTDINMYSSSYIDNWDEVNR